MKERNQSYPLTRPEAALPNLVTLFRCVRLQLPSSTDMLTTYYPGWVDVEIVIKEVKMVLAC